MTGSVAERESCVYLDELAPVQARVGWGRLGTGGNLGYEGGAVSVGGVRYEHALSTHPPARVLYYVGGTASTFRCAVALNDDVPPGASHADFSVIADGRELATAHRVTAGEPPQDLEVDVAGVHLLELVVTSARWEFAHALWLQPQVDGVATETARPLLADCLGYAEIERLPPLPRTVRCVATVVSAGYEELLDNMLGSMVANGACPDATIVVFVLGPSPGCDRVIAKYRAVPVRCQPRRAVTRGSKSILYSAARVIDAERYLCLDADTVVLGQVGSIFAALDVCPEDTVLVCREGNSHGYRDLTHVLEHAYAGEPADFARILGQVRGESTYELVTNDGVFAAARTALLALDGVIRAMPGARDWLEARPEVSWRNQFIFNLAIARLDCGVEMDPTNNVQLHTSEVEVESLSVRPKVSWQGRPVRILHVSGSGRRKLPDLWSLYASVPDPLVGAGDGDGYGEFLDTLRGWVGRHGLAGLERSFYGTWDQDGGRVRDPSTLPVLALLHYLIRADGCVRVLETGTMHGVSAACLASAVAHRPAGRVVSFDPFDYPGRAELWASLPDRMRAAIEPRRIDSLEGLAAALGAGEEYDGALLDSLHTEDHVWGEFELATQLVRPGGPILVHDWRWELDVQRVLARMERAGYGVVRLLGPGDVEEESGLGLALIENCGSTS
jgi:predicted O-methyltransferase YrrM